jgi:hypothetical protein
MRPWSAKRVTERGDKPSCSATARAVSRSYVGVSFIVSTIRQSTLPTNETRWD